MYEIELNGNKKNITQVSPEQFIVNEENIILDEVVLSASMRHVIVNNRSYSIELVAIKKENKEVEIKINNRLYSVRVKDQFDLLLNKLGMADMASKKVKDIKAPMPGLVIETLIEKGQEVKEGDSLLILEAMKMENVIKSPVDGVIKDILVEPTNTVEKNQLLILFQ